MWPILLDMTKEESMQHLRCLEIDAFSGLVAALRAQGTLSTAKLNLLKETSNMLHISQERHKAEIRRVVNDERLNTIAYHVNGERHCGEEWADEGQRLIPLMPRVAPQTAYAAIADEAADATSKLNKHLPSPACTERKRAAPSPPASTPSSSAGGQRDVVERKRKQSFSVENCVLAQHLMAPPKISKIQQIYRQRSKGRLKEQLGRLKRQQEPDASASNAVAPAAKHKVNVLQNITTAAAAEKHPRVQDKAAATTAATNASKTITTTDGQKLIVVSTHVTPSNHTASLASSILQRTLTTLPLKHVAVTPRFRVVPKATNYAASVARQRVVSVRPAQRRANASTFTSPPPPNIQTIPAKATQLLPLSRAELARQKRIARVVATEVNGVEADDVAVKRDNGLQEPRDVDGVSTKILRPLRAEGAMNDVRGNGHDRDFGGEDVPESVEEEVVPREATDVVFEDKVDLDSSVYIYGDNDNASEEVIIDAIGAPPMEVLNAVHALDESLLNVKNVRS